MWLIAGGIIAVIVGFKFIINKTGAKVEPYDFTRTPEDDAVRGLYDPSSVYYDLENKK